MTNVTFDLLADTDDCLSGDKPLFLRIPAVNLWTHERSEMRRDLEMEDPDHTAVYENLINWVEEHKSKGEIGIASLNAPTLLSNDYAQSLQSISKALNCAEKEGERLKEFCAGILAEKASPIALRNCIGHYVRGEFWDERLEVFFSRNVSKGSSWFLYREEIRAASASRYSP